MIFGQPASTPLMGLTSLMTQQAVIERDDVTLDAYGGESSRDWDELATVPCFLWWGSGAMITRMGLVVSQPETVVDRNIGGMLMPPDTDVAAHDRIARVLDENGHTLVEGPLKIVAAANFEGVTELSFQRVI